MPLKSASFNHLEMEELLSLASQNPFERVNNMKNNKKRGQEKMSKAYGISNHRRLIFQRHYGSQIFTCLLHSGKGFVEM